MPDDRFSYQNLRVYQDLLRSISSAQEIASRWDSVHAIVDHFDRASEGALVCLAEACRTHQATSRSESIDYSLGSTLECAACFDIALCKSLCSQDDADRIKQEFRSVFRQLHALRRSWQARETGNVRDDGTEYGGNVVFSHERLDAYQLALQVIHSLSSFRLLDRLSRSDFRRIDEAATSIVLNIAEGNGRLSHLDHGRFIEIACRSTTKLAARIELCAVRGGVAQKEADEIIRLLVRVDQTTARLAEYWRTQG
jgi:four helix bundle protein